MSATMQDPTTTAPKQAPAKAQVAARPGPRVSTPGAGGAGVPRRRIRRKVLIAATLLILAAGAGFAWAEYTGTDVRTALADAWHKLTGHDVPEGFALTHGRIEATKVFITTKYQGRIESVLAREGDTVEVGQVLARMDTRTLKAQLRQAEAHIERAKEAKATASAVLAQRKAELMFYESDAERQKRLSENQTTSRQEYESADAKWKAGQAAYQAAKSQVVEAEATIQAALADADRLRVDIEDGDLVSPRRGRIQYRLAEPGEVLASGGRVLDSIDLTDVYMLFYLPEAEAGKVTTGAEARLILDALPDAVIPATVYFVAPEAQFTPKTVETRTERQKLAFQVRARIDPELLRKYEAYVRTGLPGVIYVRLDPATQWPQRLQVHIPKEAQP